MWNFTLEPSYRWLLSGRWHNLVLPPPGSRDTFQMWTRAIAYRPTQSKGSYNLHVGIFAFLDEEAWAVTLTHNSMLPVRQAETWGWKPPACSRAEGPQILTSHISELQTEKSLTPRTSPIFLAFISIPPKAKGNKNHHHLLKLGVRSPSGVHSVMYKKTCSSSWLTSFYHDWLGQGTDLGKSDPSHINPSQYPIVSSSLMFVAGQ